MPQRREAADRIPPKQNFAGGSGSRRRTVLSRSLCARTEAGINSSVARKNRVMAE